MRALPRAVSAVAIAAACVGLATPSNADVTWLVDGAFDDGGTVSGHFTIDVYGYLLNNFTLTTTAGGKLPGFTYDASDSYYSNGTFYVDAQPGYQADLHLTFADSLVFASSNNPLVGGPAGPSWECAGSYSCYLPADGSIRYIASGTAAGSIPEPATWAMMALGFAALGLARHRKAQTARAVTA